MRNSLLVFAISVCLVHQTLTQATLATASSQPSCLDEKGAKVDWYFAIRIPASKAPVLARDYIVYDSSSKDFRTTNEELIKQLFAQVRLNQHKVATWSDQKPGTEDSSSGSKAHSKGVLVVNSESKGFILSHSVPRWPELTTSSLNPITPQKSIYGQHFLCINLNGG